MEKVSTIWVYILKGDNGKYYTGITNHIIRRLKEHRSGSSRSTRKYGKIELMWTHTVSERKQARELEVLIKHKGAAKFIERFGQGQLEWPRGNQGIKTKGEGRAVSREFKNEYGKGFVEVDKGKEEKEEKEKRKGSQA